MLKLETTRLRFERYTIEDLPFIEMLVTDASVMKFIGSGEAQDAAYAQQLLARMMEQYDNFEVFGLHRLILKETDESIGHAGLVAQVIDDAFEIELGYWIAPGFWRKGYATEAAKALKGYAEDELELERFISVIQIDNEASIKIAVANSLQLEKTIDHGGKLVHVYIN